MAKSRTQLEYELELAEANGEALEEENEKLRKALSEIATTVASTLDEEHIRDWAEGGRLGDALIGIKDMVADVLKIES